MNSMATSTESSVGWVRSKVHNSSARSSCTTCCHYEKSEINASLVFHHSILNEWEKQRRLTSSIYRKQRQSETLLEQHPSKGIRVKKLVWFSTRHGSWNYQPRSWILCMILFIVCLSMRVLFKFVCARVRKTQKRTNEPGRERERKKKQRTNDFHTTYLLIH